MDKKATFLAPQILGKNQTIAPLGSYSPEVGFGPIPPSWGQRLPHAGTYDKEWEDTRHPLSPVDFKYDFYNVAHPSLIYDGYLKGGETVSLAGLSHSGEVTFTLPEYEINAGFTDVQGVSFRGTGRLDTLHIDVDEMKAHLVWRVTVYYNELNVPVERVVLLMKDNKKK